MFLVRHSVPSFRREWDWYEMRMFQNLHDNGWELHHYGPLGPQVAKQHYKHR